MTAIDRLLRSHRRTAVTALAVAGASTLAISLAAPVAAKPAARLATPSSITVVSNSAGLSLTWHHTNNVTGYLVEQAQNSGFSAGLIKYKTRGIQKVFTPSQVSDGVKYYFRVAAVNGTRKSSFSRSVSATDLVHDSTIRVLSYNVRSAKFDGETAPGGVVAPFSKRLPGILYLLKQSNADVIGIEEAAFCMAHPHGQPCIRQIDQITSGLPAYTLDDTTKGRCYGVAGSTCRYVADDILYKSNVVTPSGNGGHFLIGPNTSLGRYGAYQTFTVNATRARFLYVATHTLASGSDQGRGAETKSLLTQSKAYAAKHGIPNVLIVGDFNSYVGEYHVNDVSGTVMRNANFPDSIGEARHYSNAKYDSINAYQRTPKQGHGSSDHIYASRGIGILKWGELLHLSNGRFVGTIPSDHNPIYADVELPY